jgi:hypothetical protein
MTGQAAPRSASSWWRRFWVDREVVVQRVPWRRVLIWALLGWVGSLAFVTLDYRRTSEAIGPLVVTERIMPAAAVLEADLGPRYVNPRGPHDGAYFYVIARQPMHPEAAAEGLDRPRYRLQRILFPVLGWVFHPSGGGEGLVWSLAAVGAAGVLLLGVAVGATSTSLGGPAWLAALIPVTGGCTVSMRITTPDPLAVALALLAVACALHRRLLPAVLLGVAAVLTKESMLVVLAGYALWQRGRLGALLVAIPGAAAVAWWLTLRVVVPTVDGQQVIEFTAPFAGWMDSIEFWSSGKEPAGMVWVLFGLVAAAAALARGGFRHPLGWIVAAHLVLLVPLISSALAPERSASRTTLPLLAAALVVVTTADTFEIAGARPTPTNKRS